MKSADWDNLKTLYNPLKNQVVIVDVPRMNFLMVDGQGDPNTAQEYKDAVEALYSVSYTLRFAVKKAQSIAYEVMPLEGLWWASGIGEVSIAQLLAKKDTWQWTMMIAQSPYVTRQMLKPAVEELARKKDVAALDRVRFETFQEGKAAQVLHIGPYSAELPTVERLHGFIAENGYTPCGKHHEIYLGDPRKSAPEKLKTVLRQPIR